jgi:hypothetical protein
MQSFETLNPPVKLDFRVLPQQLRISIGAGVMKVLTQ